MVAGAPRCWACCWARAAGLRGGTRHAGITDGCTVHVVKAASNNAQQQAATVAAARPSVPASGAPSLGAASPSAATAGLLSRGGGGGGGPPSMAAMQQQMQQNPDMMRQILNSPLTDVRGNATETLAYLGRSPS